MIDSDTLESLLAVLGGFTVAAGVVYFTGIPWVDAPKPIKKSGSPDHPSGNTIPIKNTYPFRKIADYINSPWDPINNAQKIEFYDADNMPRTDFITTGGGRLPVYGFVHHGRSNLPGYPTTANTGTTLATEKPITTRPPVKNLDEHKSLFNSYLTNVK